MLDPLNIYFFFVHRLRRKAFPAKLRNEVVLDLNYLDVKNKIIPELADKAIADKSAFDICVCMVQFASPVQTES